MRSGSYLRRVKREEHECHMLGFGYNNITVFKSAKNILSHYSQATILRPGTCVWRKTRFLASAWMLSLVSRLLNHHHDGKIEPVRH